jgi:hypothetical protein
MTQELFEAYKSTNFNVTEPNITIKVDHVNPMLDELLLKHNAICYAYITAENPYGKSYTKEQNELRHQQLLDATSHFVVYEGEGAGEDTTWPPERSLLILNISKEEAIALGKQFEQNAIVLGNIHGAPELVICVEWDV